MGLNDLEVALVRLAAELRVIEAVAGTHLCTGARLALDDAITATHETRAARVRWLLNLDDHPDASTTQLAVHEGDAA